MCVDRGYSLDVGRKSRPGFYLKNRTAFIVKFHISCSFLVAEKASFKVGSSLVIILGISRPSEG